MASKATDQVTKRGVNIGKSSFHLIGLEWPLGVQAVWKRGWCYDSPVLAAGGFDEAFC